MLASVHISDIQGHSGSVRHFGKQRAAAALPSLASHGIYHSDAPAGTARGVPGL